MERIRANTSLLKGKRAENGMSQEEVGKLLNISSISYRLKEKGDYDFSQTEITNLAKILKLTMEDVNCIFFEGKVTDMLKTQSKITV